MLELLLALLALVGVVLFWIMAPTPAPPRRARHETTGAASAASGRADVARVATCVACGRLRRRDELERHEGEWVCRDYAECERAWAQRRGPAA